MIARRITPIWLLQFLLLIGILASVVGYVGCFSIVQSSESTSGPVSWLYLEAGLSVVRLAIWAWNPRGDDAPPLEIILDLTNTNIIPFPLATKPRALLQVGRGLRGNLKIQLEGAASHPSARLPEDYHVVRRAH